MGRVLVTDDEWVRVGTLHALDEHVTPRIGAESSGSPPVRAREPLPRQSWEHAMGPIENILTAKGHELYVAAPEDTVLTAVTAMCAAQISSLLIMEGDVLSGIFCERDLMTRVVLARLDPDTTTLGDVMTRDVVCIAPDVSVRDAMRVMTARRVRHLPVANDRRIIGLVSIGDLVRWTAEEHTHQIEDGNHLIADLNDYVSGRYPG
jgi:CBS domain-containing protein